MKNSKKILTVLALSSGSFCGASLQASLENLQKKNKTSCDARGLGKWETAESAYKRWKELSPRARADNFRSLVVCHFDIGPFLWEAWDLLDNQTKAEKFGDFAEGCHITFMDYRCMILPEGAKMIWNAWDQLIKENVVKPSNFKSLCNCLDDVRRKTGDSDFKAAYDQDMKKIVDNYKLLYGEREKYKSVDKGGDECSLFSFLPNAAKELLLESFLDKSKDKELAKQKLMAHYNLDEDEEDWDFMDEDSDDIDGDSDE